MPGLMLTGFMVNLKTKFNILLVHWIILYFRSIRHFPSPYPCTVSFFKLFWQSFSGQYTLPDQEREETYIPLYWCYAYSYVTHTASLTKRDNLVLYHRDDIWEETIMMCLPRCNHANGLGLSLSIRLQQLRQELLWLSLKFLDLYYHFHSL